MIEADPRVSMPPLNSSANNVIPLFGKRAPARSAPGTFRNPSFDYGDIAPRTRNRRNPLRRHYQRLELAIVEANKLDHHKANWLDSVRDGVEAARDLADELARIVKQAEG